ncbi:MAG: hypothetical protein ABI409_13285 [Ramlibacter sp.]
MATNAAPQAAATSRLREEYFAAQSEERATWRYLSDTTLAQAERDQVYARWKLAASLTRLLALKLQQPSAQPGSEGRDDSSQ